MWIQSPNPRMRAIGLKAHSASAKIRGKYSNTDEEHIPNGIERVRVVTSTLTLGEF